MHTQYIHISIIHIFILFYVDTSGSLVDNKNMLSTILHYHKTIHDLLTSSSQIVVSDDEF